MGVYTRFPRGQGSRPVARSIFEAERGPATGAGPRDFRRLRYGRAEAGERPPVYPMIGISLPLATSSFGMWISRMPCFMWALMWSRSMWAGSTKVRQNVP